MYVAINSFTFANCMIRQESGRVAVLNVTKTWKEAQEEHEEYQRRYRQLLPLYLANISLK